jgi:hypothetical protein
MVYIWYLFNTGSDPQLSGFLLMVQALALNRAMERAARHTCLLGDY